MADKLGVRAHIQSYFNKLETWTGGDLLKFKKVRFRLPTLGRDQPPAAGTLGIDG